jgi:hypothetical protein
LPFRISRNSRPIFILIETRPEETANDHFPAAGTPVIRACETVTCFHSEVKMRAIYSHSGKNESDLLSKPEFPVRVPVHDCLNPCLFALLFLPYNWGNSDIGN